MGRKHVDRDAGERSIRAKRNICAKGRVRELGARVPGVHVLGRGREESGKLNRNDVIGMGWVRNIENLKKLKTKIFIVKKVILYE